MKRFLGFLVFLVCPLFARNGLTNLSSRATITPTSPVISGFVVQNDASLLLIRVVGPGLIKLGVPNAHPNPRLALYSSDQKLIRELDDWSELDALGREEVRTVAKMCGAFPLDENSRDAALVVRLEKGSYTIHARPSEKDSQDQSGMILIEVYDVAP